ncbi:plant seed peroxygenase [Ranunculus cassubicifolius]
MSAVASKVPVTAKHKIRSDLDEKIPKPYLARVLVCPDIEHPTGNLPVRSSELTVLHQHAAFFDQDGDGIIYPWETYTGCIVINTVFSYPSLPGWLPSPLFPIYIKNIHRTLHGSDTGTFDHEGGFVPANFENMFTKYAHTEPDKFTLVELWKMVTGNRDIYDLVGRIANLLEWGFLFYIASDENWMLNKEDMKNCYDGSLFKQLARKTQERKKFVTIPTLCVSLLLGNSLFSFRISFGF